jgi:hypothetical protein
MGDEYGGFVIDDFSGCSGIQERGSAALRMGVLARFPQGETHRYFGDKDV